VVWLGITGVVLIVAGVFVPMFGPMLGRDFGRLQLALCGAGLAAWGAAVIARKLRGTREDSVDGDAAGDFHDHDGHNGGHGDGEGDGH